MLTQKQKLELTLQFVKACTEHDEATINGFTYRKRQEFKAAVRDFLVDEVVPALDDQQFHFARTIDFLWDGAAPKPRLYPYKTQIILQGDVVAKKNRQRIVYIGGHPSIRPSKAYDAWHKEQVKAFPKMELLHAPYDISVTFYPSTKVAADLTNAIESINDLLVDVGVLEDDNWFLLGDVHPSFGGVDRINPRAEITILSSEKIERANDSELAA